MALHRILSFTLAVVAGQSAFAHAKPRPGKQPERLQYHPIRVDAQGMILPWQYTDPARAFDGAIRLTWKFWDTMAPDRNGLPYHMNHQVWRPMLDDHRGLGGDQIQMALSSLALLYQYLGNESYDDGKRTSETGRVIENMRFMADWYLTHGLSGPNDKWPNLPYPYNTLLYSGIYDGDMILGKGYTQPDKAGSLGWELITLHKITRNPRYLEAAVAIANTLAAMTKEGGDNDNSPLPFKVHAQTGKTGVLIKYENGTRIETNSSYSTNWAATLRLFAELQRMKQGNTAAFAKAHATILAWMKTYPLKTNKWGPFFEDMPGWSDTQINALTFADFIMDHPALFPNWRDDVQSIFKWAHQNFDNKTWEKYGVIAIDEQTTFRMPGNSHTSRQAASELRYAELTGDTSHNAENVRRLSWATYMVDVDGKNRYLNDDVWLTDGYGDYIRHYLRAMASTPELVPADQDHILRSSTVVGGLTYGPKEIIYKTFEFPSVEKIHMAQKPKAVWQGRDRNIPVTEGPVASDAEGWSWEALKGKHGILRIRHDKHGSVRIER